MANAGFDAYLTIRVIWKFNLNLSMDKLLKLIELDYNTWTFMVWDFYPHTTQYQKQHNHPQHLSPNICSCLNNLT